MGLSMGTMGTYDMVIRFPEIFAAAIPICGIVNHEMHIPPYSRLEWIYNT